MKILQRPRRKRHRTHYKAKARTRIDPRKIWDIVHNISPLQGSLDFFTLVTHCANVYSTERVLQQLTHFRDDRLRRDSGNGFPRQV